MTATEGHGLLASRVWVLLRTDAAELPHQVPEGYEPPRPGRASRFLSRRFGG